MALLDNETDINLINKKHAHALDFPYTIDNRLRLININKYITVMLGICKNEEIFINSVRIEQLFLIIRYIN